jgi:hypothetical protein
MIMNDETLTKPVGVATTAKDTPKAEPSSMAASGDAIVKPNTGELVEKHKRKYTKRADKAGKEAQSAVPIVDPAFAINVELLKKTVNAAGGAVDSFVQRTLYRKSVPVFAFVNKGDGEKEAMQLAASASISPAELEIASESTSILFAQNPLLMRHAPWLMLGVIAASYGTRVFLAFNQLDAIEREVRKMKNEAAKI